MIFYYKCTVFLNLIIGIFNKKIMTERKKNIGLDMCVYAKQNQ